MPGSTRARGANATMRVATEAAYGTPPVAGYLAVPFVSSSIGEDRPLLDDDTLGHGREMQDPTYDVATATGDVVVPLDVRNLGCWLTLMMGQATSTANAGEVTHVFASGAVDVPSASIEIGHPEVPSYSTVFGAKVNQLKFDLKRSGLSAMTASIIARGESDPAGASVAANPTVLAELRFAQASGSLQIDGQPVGNILSASLTLSNNLEAVETIAADGRIGGADPGMFGATGSITVLFDSNAQVAKARAGVPVALVFNWANGPHSLSIDISRAFLPITKKSISGPKGIQRDYNFSASGAQGSAAIVTLTNDVAAYN